MKAIFKREFRSYFTSPIGYVFAAVILFFEGMFFALLYSNGMTDITGVFSIVTYVLAFVLPVLTMRMLSEDRKLKVDQALLTAPVSIGGVVMGKFLAAFAVFCIPVAPTLLFQVIIAAKISVNWLLYLNSLVGILLLGAALIAIGMFISSLTESSVISCILTLVIFLLLTMATALSNFISAEWVASAVRYVALFDMYSGFMESVFHITDVVYLLSLTVVFCFLSVRAVEKRRWA